MNSRSIRSVVWILALAALAMGSQAVAAPAARDKKADPVPEMKRRAQEGFIKERDAAIQELGGVNKEKLREHKVVAFLLEKFIRNAGAPPRLRRSAVDALAKIAGNTDTSMKKRILSDLVRVLESSSELVIVRAKVAGVLYRLVDPKGLGDDRRAIDVLERIVKGNEEPALKVQAVQALGEIGAESSFSVIQPLTRSRDEGIAQAAREALDQWIRKNEKLLGDRERAPMCRLLAQQIGDKGLPHESRKSAMLTSARLKCRVAKEKVEKLLLSQKIENKDDEELVLAGIKALALYRDPKTAKTLTKVYKDFNKEDDVGIRTDVCNAMGEFYEPLAASKAAAAAIVQLITKFLIDVLYEEKKSGVVEAASYSLGNLSIHKRFPRRKAIEALIEALADDDESVRKVCKESLELITGGLVFPRKEEDKKDFQARWKKWFKKNTRRFPR